MKDETIFVFIMMFIIIGIKILFGYIGGYKQGQIDAIRGNVKYELVEQHDSSTQWEKIKREDFPE